MKFPPILNKFEFSRWKSTSKYFPLAIMITCCGYIEKRCIKLTKVIAKVTLELNPGERESISVAKSVFEKWRLSGDDTRRGRFTEV